MTIDAPDRMSLAEIDAQIFEARAALEAAEAAEADTSRRVDDAREGFSLGRLARSALLGVQKSLAQRQEESAQAAARVRALDKLRAAEVDRLAAVALQAKREKSAALAAERAELTEWIGDFIARTIAEEAEIAAVCADHSARSAGTFLSQFRPPSAYGAWDGVQYGLSKVATYFPAPKQATKPTTTKIKEANHGK